MDYKDLSAEQQAFVDAALAGHDILVDACIGSGKTTAIQALCNCIDSQKLVLYLTYNKLLKLDAKARIKGRNVEVTNYHGFCYGELGSHGIARSVQDCIQIYNQEKPSPRPYDVLILDEYQDIDQEISDMLRHIKDCCPNIQIIAVGDMAQKIYDRTRLNAAVFMERFLSPSHLKLEFTQCFRLNEEYAAQLGEIWGKKIVGTNDRCFVQVMTFQQAFDFLADQDPGEILCLGSNTGKRSEMLNMLENEFPRKFNKYTVWSKITESEGGATEPTPDTAIFTTFDGCKGMERDICVVFDWTDDYWFTRIWKPDAKYEILRNIFCVAASRGKEKIIFVRGPHMLEMDTLKDDPQMKIGLRDVAISSMFDFKFVEDVEAAYGALNIREIQPTEEDIDVPVRDGMIDLSPCVGIYQEAAYFDKYDIDRDIELYFALNRDKEFKKRDYKDWTLDQKILYLVSLESGQNRYLNQVHPPFVSEDAWNEIEARLSTHLHKNANVQVSCDLPFFSKGSLSFMASGFADAVENNTVFELKFVSALAHTHFLQCASYMAAMDIPRGILWNVRTNQMFEITIPNRQVFLNKVVNAVTKGRIGRYLKPEKQNPKPAGKQQVEKASSIPPSKKSNKKKGQPKVVVKKKNAAKRELIKTPNELRIVGGKRVWDLPG